MFNAICGFCDKNFTHLMRLMYLGVVLFIMYCFFQELSKIQDTAIKNSIVYGFIIACYLGSWPKD